MMGSVMLMTITAVPVYYSPIVCWQGIELFKILRSFSRPQLFVIITSKDHNDK